MFQQSGCNLKVFIVKLYSDSTFGNVPILLVEGFHAITCSLKLLFSYRLVRIPKNPLANTIRIENVVSGWKQGSASRVFSLVEKEKENKSNFFIVGYLLVNDVV